MAFQSFTQKPQTIKLHCQDSTTWRVTISILWNGQYQLHWKTSNSLKENTATNSEATDHYCRYRRFLQISNKNTNNQTKKRQQPSRVVTWESGFALKISMSVSRQCSVSLVILEMQIKNRKAPWHLPSKYFRSEAGPCSLGYSCEDAISRLVRPGPSGKHRLS